MGLQLDRVILTAADFSGADLSLARLSNVDEWCGLMEARMHLADLSQVDLSGSILTAADLSSSHFHGVTSQVR